LRIAEPRTQRRGAALEQPVRRAAVDELLEAGYAGVLVEIVNEVYLPLIRGRGGEPDGRVRRPPRRGVAALR
jgi:hypothetical protein